MHELSADNASDYLRGTGWLGPGPFAVAELAGGVSNVVLRVEVPGGRPVVLKQARPQLRTAEPWFSDVARVFREQEVMRLLGHILPAGEVPRVLHADPDNYAFVMTHAPLDARDWRTVLLGGDIDPSLGPAAGQMLGRVHAATAARAAALAPLRERKVFEQLRVEPFYGKVAERHPDLAPAVRPLVERLRTASEGLCHGDYSPKNLLLSNGRFTLVDHEAAHLGDPAMDLGFFLSHLLLKAVRMPGRRQELFVLTRAFWAAYRGAVGQAAAAWLPFAVPHCGVCLVARVDGTSPAPYLAGDERRRDAARRLGRRLLLDRPADWAAVLDAADAEVRHFRD